MAAVKALVCTVTSAALVAACGGDTGRDAETGAGGFAAATGGAVSGGTDSGGTSTGGAPTGGTATGGVLESTGGTPADQCPRDCSDAPALDSYYCTQCWGFSGPPEVCQLPLPPGETVAGVAFDCQVLGPDQLQFEGDQIVFVGEACDMLQSDPPPRVDILIGCMMDA